MIFEARDHALNCDLHFRDPPTCIGLEHLWPEAIMYTYGPANQYSPVMKCITE